MSAIACFQRRAGFAIVVDAFRGCQPVETTAEGDQT
jgi:hypothetical protein